MDIGESVVATGMTIGQPFVIKPQQVQQGGMQVMDMDLVLDGRESELIGCPVDNAAANTATDPLHRKRRAGFPG